MDIPYGKCFVVDKGQVSTESLADYVRKTRIKQNLSLADVSARAGGAIGTTYINRIENGQSTNPSPRKLRALAHGLGVPEEEIFAVARGRFPQKGEDAREAQLLSYFRELPADRQEDVVTIARSLHDQHGVRSRSNVKKKSKRAA